jgi:hypothetical protein
MQLLLLVSAAAFEPSSFTRLLVGVEGLQEWQTSEYDACILAFVLLFSF